MPPPEGLRIFKPVLRRVAGLLRRLALRFAPPRLRRREGFAFLVELLAALFATGLERRLFAFLATFFFLLFGLLSVAGKEGFQTLASERLFAAIGLTPCRLRGCYSRQVPPLL
jgi:hypothetical protein